MGKFFPRNELAFDGIELKDCPRKKPQLFPDCLRNRDLSLLGKDCIHTYTVGIPTESVDAKNVARELVGTH